MTMILGWNKIKSSFSFLDIEALTSHIILSEFMKTAGLIISEELQFMRYHSKKIDYCLVQQQEGGKKFVFTSVQLQSK